MGSINSIPGIDLEKTIEALGVPEIVYFEMLGGFRRDIMSKVELIREKVTLSDLTDFVILVHGVKGAARTVGIDKLADAMYALELAGKGNDRTTIDANLESALELYESYDEILKPYDSSLDQTPENNGELSETRDILRKLKTCLEEFESEKSENLIRELSCAPLTKEQKNVFARLMTAMDNFDYFTSLECVKEMMEVSEV